MASTQKSREEHARAAAQKAADELAVSRRDHAHDAAPASPRGGGILSSVQDSARSVMGAVRSTFSGGGGARRDETSATDKAAAAAESAREYAADMKEGARRALAGDAVGRKGETDESAWQQGEDVRRRAAEKAREEARRTHEPSEEEKGRAATANIYGKAAGAAGAFGEKMVMPTDVVERKRAEAAGGKGTGGEAAATTAMTGGRGGEPEEDVMLRVKAADQMTGQAFNDVGAMGEEGTGVPRRR
ncbi:hypothetical protein C2845_PM07G06570 [Panicum miliaceum]|uniref:Embryonic protein DC-8-like n=1 Tax=Panicum miliaceum TaxID=4540 RepID=A0A3L6SPE5_PANMI|nr:hypothetical protein C2845_PM07G06570 [Panicum miliaceum]